LTESYASFSPEGSEETNEPERLAAGRRAGRAPRARHAEEPEAGPDRQGDREPDDGEPVDLGT
jgi:hypothetical protein